MSVLWSVVQRGDGRRACYDHRMMLPPTTDAAIAEFSAHVRACFGPRVAHFVLFGSQARGEATENSDVDVLVVIDQLSSTDAREIDAMVGDILTRYGRAPVAAAPQRGTLRRAACTGASSRGRDRP